MHMPGVVACNWLLRLAVAVCCAVLPLTGWTVENALQLVGRVDLPGAQGRLDHMALDPGRQRLFVAALGANALEVVDIAAQQRTSELDGLSEPQGVAYLSTLQRLFVANGRAGRVDAFDGTSRVGGVAGLPDADNLRLDSRSGNLYVGYGRGLAVLDARSLGILQRTALPGHPEAFELSERRVYVNVPGADAVVVLDRGSGQTLATWPLPHGSMNFPMALDEADHRLFVATRRPAGLHVFDTQTGRKVVEKPLCGDADDLFWDAQRHRLYAICGEGKVAVLTRRSADEYELVASIGTAPGARTGLFEAGLERLFVAAPARDGHGAAVLIYSTAQASPGSR